MKVSVVVPCYNHARYIDHCLRSIDGQDHDDLDVIVIDDGSTDDTWARITAFQWSASRQVRMIRTKNAGAHAALNRGLDLALGEYVALCNSDDAFAPKRISTLLRHAKAGARFLFSAVRSIDEAGNDVTRAWDYPRDLDDKQRAIQTFPSVGFSLVLTNTTISTGNFFFERKLVREVGYFRPYRYCHDWDYVLRVLLVTEPEFVPEPLYRYRLHPNNSFRALADAAARECPELMRRFLKAAVTGDPSNPLCPSPSNWPVFFDLFMAEHQYAPYLAAWDSVDGPRYVPTHAERTSGVVEVRAVGAVAEAELPAVG